MALYTHNNISTPSSLASGITNVALSFTVQTGHGATYPSGRQKVLIEDEIVDVSSRTGDVFTIISGGRGYGGTTAVSHLADARVDLVVTSEDYVALLDSAGGFYVQDSLFLGGNNIYNVPVIQSVNPGTMALSAYGGLTLQSIPTGAAGSANIYINDSGGTSRLRQQFSSGDILFLDETAAAALRWDQSAGYWDFSKPTLQTRDQVVSSNRPQANLSNGTWFYRNGIGTSIAQTGFTGTFAIKVPSNETAMSHFRIHIYNYSGTGAVTLTLGGYTYVAGSYWVNTTAAGTGNVFSGSVDLSEVRFVNLNGTPDDWYILLGDSTTSWSYPKIMVEALQGHAGTVLSAFDIVFYETGVTDEPTWDSVTTRQVNDNSYAYSLTIGVGDLNLSNNSIIGPLDPTLGTHVGDRDYNDARYLLLSGGSLAGDLVMGSSAHQIQGSSNESLNLYGGPGATGARIELWSSDDATYPNDAYYDADLHTWRDHDAAPSFMTLSSTALTLNSIYLATPLDPTAGTHVGDRDYNDARYHITTVLSTQPMTVYDAALGKGFGFRYGTSGATNKPSGTDHAVMTMEFSADWSVQMAADWRTNNWYVREQNSGVWGAWDQLLTTGSSIDHGGLTGLGDDDHTQYHTDARAVTWIGTRDLSDVGDVTLTAIASGELLKWNGTIWINNTLAEAGISDTSHTHTHASTTGRTANDHHNQIHTLTGADHTVSGLTTGHVLQATGATTFGFAAIPSHNIVSGHSASGLTTGHVLTATGATTFAFQAATGGDHPDGDHDHGGLVGLGDDDHTIYHTDARAVTWIGTRDLSDVGDVTLTAIASGELLKWNGTGWINNTLAEAGIAQASHGHSYLSLDGSSPMSGDINLNSNDLINVLAITPSLGLDLTLNDGDWVQRIKIWDATNDGDITFYKADGTSKTMEWDESDNRWEFSGAIHMGNNDVYGVDWVGTSSSTTRMRFGTSVIAMYDSGSQVRFYMDTNATGDISWYDNASGLTLVWDESEDAWDFRYKDLFNVTDIRFNPNGLDYYDFAPASNAWSIRFYDGSAAAYRSLAYWTSYTTGTSGEGDFTLGSTSTSTILWYDHSDGAIYIDHDLGLTGTIRSSAELQFEGNQIGDYWEINGGTAFNFTFYDASGVSTKNLMHWNHWDTGTGSDGDFFLNDGNAGGIMMFDKSASLLISYQNTRFDGTAVSSATQALTTKQHRNIYVASTAPGTPLTGDVWIDTT